MIRLWEADSGRPIDTLVGRNELVSGLSWNPDSKRLVSTSGLLAVGSGGTLLCGDHTVRI